MSNSEQEPKSDRTKAPLHLQILLRCSIIMQLPLFFFSLFSYIIANLQMIWLDKLFGPFLFDFVIVHLHFGNLWSCDCKWAKTNPKSPRVEFDWAQGETASLFPPTALLLMALNGAAERLKQTKEQLQCI